LASRGRRSALWAAWLFRMATCARTTSNVVLPSAALATAVSAASSSSVADQARQAASPTDPEAAQFAPRAGRSGHSSTFRAAAADRRPSLDSDCWARATATSARAATNAALSASMSSGSSADRYLSDLPAVTIHNSNTPSGKHWRVGRRTATYPAVSLTCWSRLLGRRRAIALRSGAAKTICDHRTTRILRWTITTKGSRR
jgi:hypothetical protein